MTGMNRIIRTVPRSLAMPRQCSNRHAPIPFPCSASFTNTANSQLSGNTGHTMRLRLDHKIDSTQDIRLDANARLAGGKLRPPRLTWAKFWREAAILPVTWLRSDALAQVSHAIFHPVRAYREYRARNKS